MTIAAARAQGTWNRLCGPGAGGFGKFESARMITTGQRTVAETAKTRWIASAIQTCGRRVAAELARGPLFPAVQPDVDFEHDHGHQQHDAQTDLDPLVKLVAPAILDLIDAPGEDDDDDAHGDHQHVEHEGGPGAEKAVDPGNDRDSRSSPWRATIAEIDSTAEPDSTNGSANGRVAELADALDLKSSGGQTPCGFESRLGHLDVCKHSGRVDILVQVNRRGRCRGPLASHFWDSSMRPCFAGDTS